MDYIIVIPSYKRANQLQTKTLSCLFNAGISKEKINVFIVEEEYEEYLEMLDKNYYNKLIVGKIGLVQQREFINEYYSVGTKILSLDDDVENIDLSLTDYKNVDSFFVDAFDTCEKKGSFIFSVYPVFNPFFRKNRPNITEELTYCIGAFYGYINRHDDDLKLVLTQEGNKEDVERSILYYLKDGKTLRFNKIGFKTKYYGVGGLGGFKERLDIMKQKTIDINAKYPLFTRIKIRKNGLYEICFKKTKSVFCEEVKVEAKVEAKVEDKEVIELQKIDPSNEELLEVYNLLDNTTVLLCTNCQGRAKTFGIHRSMTMGIIRARISRKYELSCNSKKHPELYEALLKFGKSIVPFDFNAIHVNHNVVCPRHLDANNSGKSCLVSFGDYEGCNLIVEGQGEYNTNCSPIVFDGSKYYHYNTPLTSGNKYSLVFFTNSH
jgi:hypothetical protein